MVVQKKEPSRKEKDKSISRRDFIKTVSAGVVATGLGADFVKPGRIHAAKKKLKILQWFHFEGF